MANDVASVKDPGRGVGHIVGSGRSSIDDEDGVLVRGGVLETKRAKDDAKVSLRFSFRFLALFFGIVDHVQMRTWSRLTKGPPT